MGLQIGERAIVQIGECGLTAADHDGLLVTLDNHDAHAFATDDPVGFVNQHPDGLPLIDKVQWVPEVVIAIEASVKEPGRCLLAASANFLEPTATYESLAPGPVDTHMLYPCVVLRSRRHQRCFVNAVMESCRLRRDTSDHLDIVCACACGCPEALSRQGRRRRNCY